MADELVSLLPFPPDDEVDNESTVPLLDPDADLAGVEVPPSDTDNNDAGVTSPPVLDMDEAEPEPPQSAPSMQDDDEQLGGHPVLMPLGEPDEPIVAGEDQADQTRILQEVLEQFQTLPDQIAEALESLTEIG